MKKWLTLLCVLLFGCNTVKRVGTTITVDGSKSNGTNNSPIIKYQWSCTNGCIFDNPNVVKTNVKLTTSKLTLKITDAMGGTADTTIILKF